MNLNYDKIWFWLVYWLWPGEEIEEKEPNLWIVFVPIALLILAMYIYESFQRANGLFNKIVNYRTGK